MMLKNASYAQKEQIRSIWLSHFANYEKAEVQHYFDHGYDDHATIVIDDDDKVISTIHMREETLMLMQQKLEVSFLLGVATIPDYRRCDYMKDLMRHVLDEEAHNHLITLIDAFYPKLYEPFGFVSVYDKKKYQISHKLLEQVSNVNVHAASSGAQLYEVYRKYIRHFDAYIVRDVGYFDELIEKYRSIGGIAVYETAAGVQGYACYIRKEHYAEIREIVYLGSAAIMKLAHWIMRDDPYIMIHVSQDESLEKLFPLAIPKRVPHMMARINHPALFQRLYGQKAASTKEVFASLKKPMFLHMEM